ncbi:hypothetical protein ABRY94_11975 [Castellaniella ginsengisoli]|uniref:Uncharacterized protein n=1 Tax=Castellaniella ginsengisoli TaxID=546114 RepID=A0AB39ESN9_9BURK
MTPLEQAVIALVQAQDEVKRLGKEIGAAICRSEEAQGEMIYPKEPTNWLKLAYQREREAADNGYGWEYYYVNHDDDIEGYLAEHSPHALQAHLLIQQRREARRVVGAARRRVSLIGRNLVKARTQEQS